MTNLPLVQVFQLTGPILCGPVFSDKKFVINLDRETIAQDGMRCALLCVQVFVKSSQSNQNIFFSEFCVVILTASAAFFDSITTIPVFELWSHVGTPYRCQVVTEVCACVDRVLDRRRAVNGTQEQWYAVGVVSPSSEESVYRTGVRISSRVEKGHVEYAPVSALSTSTTGLSNLRSLGHQRTGTLAEAH